MKCELHDLKRTFGIELEGIIEGYNSELEEDINTRDHGCICDCEEGGCTGCTGECYCSELCECEELKDKFLEENPDATQEELNALEKIEYCPSFKHRTDIVSRN